MSTLTFDTLKFVLKLEKAGVSREQATAEAEALAEVFESGGQELVTKADLKAEITRLDNKIDSLRLDMQSRLESLEMRLTIKLGALMVVAVGMIATLMKH